MASGDTLAVFVPQNTEPPTATFAQMGARNAHPTLEYDASTEWATQFSSVLPRNYAGGGLTVTVHQAKK